MKKSRAIFGILLPILALTLSACDFLPTNLFGGKDSSQQSSSRRIRSGNSSTNRSSYNNSHVHRFTDEWSSNSQYHWHDAICGHDVKSDVAPHTIYSEVIKEATCQETGERFEYCTVCGYETTVTIPRTSHTWSEYDRKEPTCTESGYVKKYCAVCGIFAEDQLPLVDHTYEYEVLQEATCVQSEIVRMRCSVCGYEEVYDNGCLGHDYQVIYHEDSTCSQRGYDRLYCNRCGETTDSYYPIANHVWSGAETQVVPTNGVPYFTDNCLNCGLQKIAIAAASGSIEGSIKESIATTNGYIKLGSDGSALNLTFEYPNSAYVRIYQHAVYDNWNYDSYRYASYNSVSSPYEHCYDSYNFQLTVNDQIVDLSESANISYYEFLASGTQDIPALTENGFSPAADCLIGDAMLVPGINTIQYKRLGSYCLNVDYFVLVVTNTTHEHSFSPSLYGNDQYHWHQCTDPNCPMANGVIDKNPHNYYQYQVNRGESCSDLAMIVDACGDCGYQKYYYERLYHEYDVTKTSYVTNSSGYQQAIEHCALCNKTVQLYQFSCGSVYEGSYDGRLTQGTTMKWKFPVFNTGYVYLYLPMYVLSPSYLDQMFDGGLYDITFNGNSCIREDIYCTYQDLGVKYGEVKNVKFATYYVTDYDVNVGEIEVSLTSHALNYRPFFDGEIRLEY